MYKHEVAAGEASLIISPTNNECKGYPSGPLHQVSLAGGSGHPGQPCRQAVTGKYTAGLHGGRAAAAAAHHKRTQAHTL